MNKSHRAMTLEASTLLLESWSSTVEGGRFTKTAKESSHPAQIKQMKRWVVQLVEFDDVFVSEVLVDTIVDRVSRATSLQYLARCGSLGPLKGGSITGNRFDDYAWDCDPFLSWYEELANVSRADVKYHPDLKVPPESMAGHPAGRVVRGGLCWDDQKYPSSLDLAGFIGDRAVSSKNLPGDRAGNRLHDQGPGAARRGVVTDTE